MLLLAKTPKTSNYSSLHFETGYNFLAVKSKQQLRPNMVIINEKNLQKTIESYVATKMEGLFQKVIFTREFHQGKATKLSYYKRHLVETIIRIRLNNEVDAYCLYKIGYSDNYLAMKLANYLAEEYGHENYFLTDLKKFSISEEEIKNTPPLFSTQLLIGYLYHSINNDGAIPTMVWNWFVEWYSNQYNMNIAKKVEEEFGKDKVKGCLGHLQYDENEEHVELMFSTVVRIVKQEGDEDKVKQYLSNFVELIGMYFQELYDITIKAESYGKND
jgi:hypothetical protein